LEKRERKGVASDATMLLAGSSACNFARFEYVALLLLLFIGCSGAYLNLFISQSQVKKLLGKYSMHSWAFLTAVITYHPILRICMKSFLPTPHASKLSASFTFNCCRIGFSEFSDLFSTFFRSFRDLFPTSLLILILLVLFILIQTTSHNHRDFKSCE
jgi:hypothetical protein